jgi:hypothetical protein
MWLKEVHVIVSMKTSISHNGNKNIANYIVSLHMPMECKKWIPIWLMGCVHTH